MNISQLLTKLKTLVYSKSETDSLLGGKANSSHTHTKSQITDFPTIPSKTSQLTNDSGFITGISWANVSGKPSTFTPSSHIHTTMEGTYSGNGGQQGPSYYGKNRVGFLMSNATVNGDSHFKNWLYMDNYGGTDVGGATAIGVDRTEARAFIMQSDANRTSWNNSAELATRAWVTSLGYITSSGSCNYANSAGNSDTLDGYHEYSFLRYRGGTSTSGEGTLWAQIGIKGYYNALPDGLSDVYRWGEVVSLAGGNARFDIYCSHISSDGNGLYYRSGWDDDKKPWRRIIDSGNTGNISISGYQVYVG